MKPLILINFKAYKEVHGQNALHLAKICEKVSKQSESTIVIIPQLHQLSLIASHVTIPVFSPHVDSLEEGPHTGHTTPSALKAEGVQGVLINHSEKKVDLEKVAALVQLCRKHELQTHVCAPDLQTIRAILNRCTPHSIGYEPPGLIGGNISVTTNPGIIKDALLLTGRRGVELIVGAGIKTKDDIKKAHELGVSGVLISSAIIKAKDQEKALREFMEQ